MNHSDSSVVDRRSPLSRTAAAAPARRMFLIRKVPLLRELVHAHPGGGEPESGGLGADLRRFQRRPAVSGFASRARATSAGAASASSADSVSGSA